MVNPGSSTNARTQCLCSGNLETSLMDKIPGGGFSNVMNQFHNRMKQSDPPKSNVSRCIA